MKGKFLLVLAAVSLLVFMVASGCNITFTPPAPPPTASVAGTAKVKVKSPATGNLTEQPAVSSIADITITLLDKDSNEVEEGGKVVSAVAKKNDGGYKIDEVTLSSSAGDKFRVKAEYQGVNYLMETGKDFTLVEGANNYDLELEFNSRLIDVIKK